MISEVELHRINIARQRGGLPPLSMAQAKRAIESNANTGGGSFEVTPFLVDYVNKPPGDRGDGW